MGQETVRVDWVTEPLIAAVHGHAQTPAIVGHALMYHHAVKKQHVSLLEGIAHPGIGNRIDDLHAAGPQGWTNIVDAVQV